MIQYHFTFDSDHTDAMGLAESLRRIADLVERGRTRGRNKANTARWRAEDRADHNLRSQQSYRRMKADPDRYEKYLWDQRRYGMLRRSKMTPEQKARKAERDRERMRQLRADPERLAIYREQQKLHHRQYRKEGKS